MSPGERCLPAPSPAGAPEEGSGDATAVCFSLRSREKRGQRHAETKMSGQQRHRPNPGDDLRDLRELVSASSPLYGQRLSRPLPPRGAAVPPRAPEPQQGRPRWFPLRSLWEGLWPGGGEAGRGRQGMAARSRRKSSPRSEASDSAPRAGFWGRRGAHGGGTGRGQGRPQISPRPLWHTELRVSSTGGSCADPSLGEPRTLPASPPCLTTFSLLMNVCVRLNRPQGAPEAINCHYLGGRPLVG